jgi:hypothetical protein
VTLADASPSPKNAKDFVKITENCIEERKRRSLSRRA